MSLKRERWGAVHPLVLLLQGIIDRDFPESSAAFAQYGPALVDDLRDDVGPEAFRAMRADYLPEGRAGMSKVAGSLVLFADLLAALDETLHAARQARDSLTLEALIGLWRAQLVEVGFPEALAESIAQRSAQELMPLCRPPPTKKTPR
jgi:hypothetical protein